MTTSNCNGLSALPVPRLKIFPALLIVCMVFLIGPWGNCQAATANTIFLPLKINAAVNTRQLANEADTALQTAIKSKGFKLFARPAAQKDLDYNGSWPPAPPSLAKLPLPKGIEYIVTGSLTPLGSRISVDMRVFDIFAPAQSKYFYQEGNKIDLTRILAKISTDIIAFTNRNAIIAKITISGNKKIDSGAIMQKIKLRSGDKYDPALVKEAIKDVYKMGYFNNITVSSSPTERGRHLDFKVQEKSVIGAISISGESEISEDDIRDVIKLSPNNIIRNKDVRASIEGIKKLYKDKSYFNSRVTAKIEPPKSGKVNVNFHIKEGKKVYIEDISFTGNKAFKARKLKKIMQTAEKGWFSWFTNSGILNHDIVEQDSARLAAFYHNHGYVDAKVGKPRVSKKHGGIYVNFAIFEGPRYKVGSVDISGDLIESKTALLALTKLHKSKYFNRRLLRDDVLKITDRYAEKGYAFAEANPITDKDMANKRINVNIRINKKSLVHINRISIKGNSRTRDKVIRRQMLVKEGGIFNATALKASKQHLERLDYFEHVDVMPQPTADTNKMNILVNVKEKATGNFSIGAGYSSVDSFMFMTEVSQNNFLGKGQRVALKANISSNSNEYDFSFTEPHLADSDLLFGFNFYNWSRDYDDYTKKSKGVGLRLGHPVWNTWYLSGAYSFDDTILTNVSATASQTILDSMAIRYTSSIKIGLSKDTRNNPINPTSGVIYSITVKYAGGPLGGDSDFTKFEGTTSYYYPLPGDTTLHNKLSFGWAFANSSNKLPVFEKFYLGGINTIRGFKAAQISPRDPVTGEKIGGGKMWYYNLEYIFPLLKSAGLRGVTFFDAGNVYDEHDTWDFNNIKKSVGFGFRWRSPMGPLRLEWGYNLDPTKYEQQSNWDFSMGGSF
ncbi:MAG: outer membrane protein assembly factor BamA [Deltaproteobacteria bacterium]|nr:outer membrane protein assembly factor BamA [Deltaproteobacteria bacterium]